MKVKFTNVITGEAVEVDLFDQEKFNDYMTRTDYLLTLY